MTAARFLPWVSEGLGASIGAADPGGGQPLPARAELDVTASVSGNGGGTASVKVRVLGPADVTAIDARQVIRMEPAPLTSDLEPNYLPLVEFDRPDLPWLFTPAAASSSEQLRPWLCLVVVERDTEAILETPPDRLPVLKLKNASKALPSLAESWAWVHAQIAGTGDPAAILRSTDASRTLSRLLCPRRLTGKTAYIAAVVPTFEQGRLAGLRRLEAAVESAAQLQPAWTATTGALELPAYHHWEFATGAEGDFEALASSLRRVVLGPAQVGHRPMTVRALPGGLPDLGEVSFEGALGLPGDPKKPVEGDFHTALRALLNTQPPIAPGTAPAGLALPPPIYLRPLAGG